MQENPQEKGYIDCLLHRIHVGGLKETAFLQKLLGKHSAEACHAWMAQGYVEMSAINQGLAEMGFETDVEGLDDYEVRFELGSGKLK